MAVFILRQISKITVKFAAKFFDIFFVIDFAEKSKTFFEIFPKLAARFFTIRPLGGENPGDLFPGK